MFNNPNEGSDGKKSKDSFNDSWILASSKKKIQKKLDLSKLQGKVKTINNSHVQPPEKLKSSFILNEVLKMYKESKPFRTTHKTRFVSPNQNRSI